MKPRLQWPRRPSRSQHRILGLRLRWTDRSKHYRIERFPEDGDPVFIVLCNDGDWRVISHHRKLKAAKLHCHNHYRQPERKTRAQRG
jgi:hypothetical protein